MFFVANSRAHVWAHFAAPGQASTSKTTMIFHNLTPKFDSKLYFRLSIRAHRLSAQRSDPHPNSWVQFLDHSQFHPAKPIFQSSCPRVSAWNLPQWVFFPLCESPSVPLRSPIACKRVRNVLCNLPICNELLLDAYMFAFRIST